MLKSIGISLPVLLLLAAVACGSEDSPGDQPTGVPTTSVPATVPNATLTPVPTLSPTMAATATAKAISTATQTAIDNMVPTIAGDPAVIADLVVALQQRGVALNRIDLRNSTSIRDDIGGCLVAPYRAYDVPSSGRLYMLQYDSPQDAADAAATVPEDGACRQITWSNDITYFLHEDLVIFVASNYLELYDGLVELTGEPFACGAGYRGVGLCDR